MKKLLFFIFALLLLSNLISAKKGENEKWTWKQKTVRAERTPEKILIDGKLDEKIWDRDSITGFSQNDPDDGKPATEKTKVWMAYDNNAIYVAARMFDSNPEKIISLLARRDDFVDADYFLIYIDPYYDKRSGFKFAVNPTGSIADWSIFNDGWDDSSWDGIWETKARIDKKGWTVEMRIPFDQLRFKKKNNGEEYTWGVNFRRYIRRKNEIVSYSWKPKTVSGEVSHYAKLEGIKGIDPKRLFEIVPYTAGKVALGSAEEGNPFATGEIWGGNSGVDVKYGLKSNLTLDLAVNPDFGQVEVDPAVINLSAAESYYSERRPFFVEGSSIFMFGYGGANNNIGANWGNPRFFYSRRIGRPPQGDVDTDGYVRYPEWTSILTAAKISGKLGKGWNIGIMSAFTERENAEIDINGDRSESEVEPFSNYTVFRAHKEFNEGRQGIGFIATSVLRDLKDVNLKDMMNNKAFSFGIDGWTFLDKKKKWVVTGWMGRTEVSGTEERITDLQSSYPHYYQRPDVDYLGVDDEATSLSGYSGRFTLNKQEGNFMFNVALGFISPGFDSRDLGFQWDGDLINGHILFGYRSFKKWNFIKSWDAIFITQRNYDFGGNKVGEQRVIFIGDIEFTNFWSVYLQMSSKPSTMDKYQTRGGPMMLMQPYTWFDFGLRSDRRKPIVLRLGGFYLTSDWGRIRRSVFSTVEWKPGSNFSVSFSPRYDYNYNNSQWVDNIDDPIMMETYGTRYIFGNLLQKTFSCSIRLNWIFSPKLSLQAYLQPFISVGAYTDFKEFAAPGTYDFNTYGIGSSSIDYAEENEEYLVDPGDGGNTFYLGSPDFNFKSLRGTVVFRWEYKPGSTFYLVWTQNRTDDANPGIFRFGTDLRDMLSAPGDNVFMLKFTYRFKM